jgi:N-acetylgalactosamine-N,N'-diacetylbacillosaminyl-diphospho-undecaprenol 4-alpha-N-acetylgalactosaminyltransferase
MSKKNLLFINDWMYGGGAERSMSILINELAKTDKYNIKLLMLENKNSYDIDKSIEILSFRDKYRFGTISKLFTLVADPFKLNNIISQNNINVVVSFQHRSNFINVLTKYLNKDFKSIISERVYTRDYFKDNKSGFFFNFMVKWLYKKANHITCNAQDIKNGLQKFYNTNNAPVTVIENAYDVAKILELSKEKIDTDDNFLFVMNKKIIINVGRLNIQKGQRYLIESFAKMENKDDYIVIILGDGVLKDELKILTKILKVDKYVYFLGHKQNPYKYLARSDIFVFPSLYEGYPNALAEAMIFDLSIIAFDFKSGAKDLIGDNEYGTLVDVYDVDDLKQAILNENINNKKQLNKIGDLVNEYEKLF